jgi:hypothetical protein
VAQYSLSRQRCEPGIDALGDKHSTSAALLFSSWLCSFHVNDTMTRSGINPLLLQDSAKLKAWARVRRYFQSFDFRNVCCVFATFHLRISLKWIHEILL